MYIRCSCCGRVLTFNEEEFYKEKKRIISDDKMTKKQKEESFINLLNKHGYKSICCRMTKMGEIPLFDIIQPLN